MFYSYTQISQYLACPRRYRHRYLQGWLEKDTRAAMLFGRAFESALGAFFQKQDSSEVCSQFAGANFKVTSGNGTNCGLRLSATRSLATTTATRGLTPTTIPSKMLARSACGLKPIL